MIFENIKTNFNKELLDVDNYILKNLKSDIDLINDIGNYLTSYNGKKIRPVINILFNKIFNSKWNETHIIMASVIELIHTATLLHDDVVDLSEKRRKTLTVNKIWGNKEAILIGDYLYTKSFQMMVNLNNIKIFKLMSDTTNIMSQGEVKQLIYKKNFNITEKNYLDIIKCKTAQLFSATTLSSAILANCNTSNCNLAYKYGLHLGITYQLIDDILDYFCDDEKFGKNIADDILNGTFTLPLINLFSNNITIKNKIIEIILTNSKKDLLKIKHIVLKSTSINYTYKLALYHADKAKEALSLLHCSKKYLNIGLNLINFIINRKY